MNNDAEKELPTRETMVKLVVLLERLYEGLVNLGNEAGIENVQQRKSRQEARRCLDKIKFNE